LVEASQPNLQTGNDGNNCFRSSVSVVTLALFILAIATLQILSILISETPQSVYGQAQATVTDNNNIVRDLSWTSPWYDNNLKPTTSNVIAIAASISDNGNINSTPFLLPSPSSGQSSNNNNLLSDQSQQKNNKFIIKNITNIKILIIFIFLN